MEYKQNKTIYAMKEISKVKAYLDNSLDSIVSENNILKKIRHPLLANLYYSFQDKENLYLILDYLPGGSLRYYISNKFKFNENQIKFIISNIIISIEYIHNCNIIHRDLKPENLLFDNEGYLHITDFGISKEMNRDKIITDKSGTPGYISPEVIINKPQNESSDFFSIGIITYELIFGTRPFVGNNKQEIANNILNTKINLEEKDLPNNFSEYAADFINGLLKIKNNQRLGSRGIDEIKNHSWFDDIDWPGIEYQNLEEKKIPFIPDLREDKNILDNNDNKKIDKYNIILEKINREGIFNNFYFNYNDIKKRKGLHYDLNDNDDEDFCEEDKNEKTD